MKINKSGINKLYLFVIMLILCCTGIGSAAFVVSNGDNGESITNSGGTPEYAVVARKISNEPNAKWVDYYSIEDALSNSGSGDTVIAVPGSKAAIHENVSVPNGVTLAIPVIVDDLKTGNSATAKDGANDSLNSTNFSNELTLKKDVTLTIDNGGSVVVYGELAGGKGGGKYCGQPSGKVSALHMEAGSSILCKSGSSLTAYGFITDARTTSTETQGQITMLSGSTIATPYVIRDFKGGSASYAIYGARDKAKQSPFYQFEVLNVHPILEVCYGAQFNAVVNIWAGDKINQSGMTVMGTSSQSSSKGIFLQLTDPNHSKIICDYDEKTEICDVKIYGGVKMNGYDISLSISLGFISIPITFNTANFVFPLSWRHRISLLKGPEQILNANFVIPQDFKCLPGSYFEIGPGCDVKFEKSLVIYNYGDPDLEHFNDNSYTGVLHAYCVDKYPMSTTDSHFINNGNMTVGSLGGVVEAGEDGATLLISSSSEVTSNEVKNYSGTSVPSDGYDEKKKTAKSNSGTVLPKGFTYTAINGDWVFEGNIALSANNLVFNTSESGTLTLSILGLEEYEPIISTTNSNLHYTLSDPVTNTESRTRTYTITLTANVDVDCALTVSVGDKTATCQVSANQSNVPVTGVTLSPTKTNLEKGHTIQLNATVSPSDATNKNLIWSSDYSQIASVDESGTVTANAAGTAKITVRTEDGDFTATCDVNVVVSATSIEIQDGNNNVVISKTLTRTNDAKNPTLNLIAVIKPSDTTDSVEWTSSNDDDATVTEGGNGTCIVTAVGGTSEGRSVTITATCGSKSASCTVKVINNITSSGGCLVEGTLITMADGTKVPIEDIDSGDMVMAFDHEQGKFVSAPVMLNAHKDEGYKTLTVTELVFDDGTNLKIAHNHALFSLTDMNYVTLDKDNAHEFVGDTFYSYENKEIKLVATRNYTDTVRVYVPFTKGHINCVANGLLTNPGVYANFLTSIFEYKENMQVDIDARNKDIEQYGLFKYEDLSMYVNETMFNELNLQYLKIGIGKKMYTMDDVIKYLGLYKKYFK